MTLFSKRTLNYLEYLLLLLCQNIITLLPRNVALSIGAFAGTIIYKLGIYQYIVNVNMAHVDIGNPETTATIKKNLYRNLGKYAIDFLRPANPVPPYRLHGYEAIEPLLNEGKGTMVILGHLGNWELLATVFGSLTKKLHVVAKPMNNQFVDRWLLNKRTAASVTTIFSKQALRKIITVLKKDGIIAILIDQYMRNHGDPIPFLGKEAKTVSTVAGIALKTGCNVIAVHAVMDSSSTYDITVFPVEHNHNTLSTDEERLRAMQTTHNAILSQQIMEHPEHWFGWFHKRFRGYVNYNRHQSS